MNIDVYFVEEIILLIPKTCCMSAKKFLLPGLAGGVAYFFLGYLFYGILFKNTMVSPIAGVMRPIEQMIWWALITGSLLYGLLIAYVIDKTNTFTVINGAITGTIVSFLVSASFNFTMYATTYINTRTTVVYDVAISTVIGAITGAIVALIAGIGSRR